MLNGIRRGLTAGAMSLTAVTGAWAQGTPTNGNLPPGALPSSWDPTYNVCRGTDPKCYSNWVPSASRQNRVLIFTPHRRSAPRQPRHRARRRPEPAAEREQRRAGGR